MRAAKQHLNAATRRPNLQQIYSLRSRSPASLSAAIDFLSLRDAKNGFQREVIIESNPQNIKATRLSGDHNERRKFSCSLLRLALRWRLQGLRQRSPSGPLNGETFLPPSPRNFINLGVWVGDEAQRSLNFRLLPPEQIKIERSAFPRAINAQRCSTNEKPDLTPLQDNTIC